MDLSHIDQVGLMREAYRMEPLSLEEARSIFVDWALRLPVDIPSDQAISLLLAAYATDAEDHPMTRVLREGLTQAATPKRRGGRAARVPEDHS